MSDGNLVVERSLDVRACKGEGDIAVRDQDVLELSAAPIGGPTGRYRPVERFAIWPANVAVIVDHKRGCKVDRSSGNAEGYAGVQINKASPRESLSFLIAADGCGQRGADLPRDLAVKQVALAKFFLDSANLVIREKIGNKGDLKSQNQ